MGEDPGRNVERYYASIGSPQIRTSPAETKGVARVLPVDMAALPPVSRGSRAQPIQNRSKKRPGGGGANQAPIRTRAKSRTTPSPAELRTQAKSLLYQARKLREEADRKEAAAHKLLQHAEARAHDGETAKCPECKKGKRMHYEGFRSHCAAKHPKLSLTQIEKAFRRGRS